MKGVVTSFVGERKLPRTNTTKQGRSKSGGLMTGIDLPHINSMSPPIVVPGAIDMNILSAHGERGSMLPPARPHHCQKMEKKVM